MHGMMQASRSKRFAVSTAPSWSNGNGSHNTWNEVTFLHSGQTYIPRFILVNTPIGGHTHWRAYIHTHTHTHVHTHTHTHTQTYWTWTRNTLHVPHTSMLSLPAAFKCILSFCFSSQQHAMYTQMLHLRGTPTHTHRHAFHVPRNLVWLLGSHARWEWPASTTTTTTTTLIPTPLSARRAIFPCHCSVPHSESIVRYSPGGPPTHTPAHNNTIEGLCGRSIQA